MTARLSLQDVSVGYAGRTVVGGIDLAFLQGKMTCILGPNGSGKTTLLRTLAGLLSPVNGQVLLSGRNLGQIKAAELARLLSVVLTERLELSNMTGRDVVSLGRYPHIDWFGRLSAEDERIVQGCLQLCGAAKLAERPFDQLSDGEKQKVLIARALAQQPRVLILDEPTVHLDLRHKLDLLALLKRLTLTQGLTVLLTLHEPDLAIKSCDRLVLVKDAAVQAQGAVEEVVASEAFAALYGIAGAGFNPLTCGAELPAAPGLDLFIVGGGGSATPLFRACARLAVGCAGGVLHQGDLDCYTAMNMGLPLISVPAFSHIGDRDIDAAWALARQYRLVLDSGFPWGEANQANRRLFALACEHGQELLSLRQPSPPGARPVRGLDELIAILEQRG